MTVEQNIKDKRKAKQMVKAILPNLKIYNQYVNRCRNFAQVLNCSQVGGLGRIKAVSASYPNPDIS